MTVDVALDGDDALDRLAVSGYDVVVLDRDLPGVHGDDICRALAAERSASRILMLTAARSVRDRVEGLGLGADDYLPKPFDFTELVARIQALARRPGAPAPAGLGYRDLSMDPELRIVTRAGRRLALTPKELAVLECLLNADGRPVPAEDLLRRVWDGTGRPVHHHRQDHHRPPARQARGPAGDRDRPRERLPDRRTVMHRAFCPWPRPPRRTARLRLTALYGALFLACGAVLLVVTYVLVERAIDPVNVNRVIDLKMPFALSLTGRGRSSAGQLTPLEVTLAKAIAGADLGQVLIQAPIALAIVTVLAVALGWVVAGRILRPLSTITAAARRISASNLNERLGLRGPDDELKALGDTLDDLFTRLETSFQAQRHFVANASHELRTPLTRERTMLQVALDDPGTTAETWRETARDVLASNAEQEGLIEALLALATSEGGLDRREPVDLAAVTGEVLLARRDEADRLGLHIETDTQPAVFSGDSLLAERLVANLIDNAVRHNVADGMVEVTTGSKNGCAVLSVASTGPVIPPDEVARLFEPFQRLHPRGTRTGTSNDAQNGHGLGLSIVRAIATAHGAAVGARALPGGGLAIDVTFPGQPNSASAPR